LRQHQEREGDDSIPALQVPAGLQALNRVERAAR